MNKILAIGNVFFNLKFLSWNILHSGAQNV